MPSRSARRAQPSRELLLDLVAVFNTEAAYATAEEERIRLADAAKDLEACALQTCAMPRRGA